MKTDNTMIAWLFLIVCFFPNEKTLGQWQPTNGPYGGIVYTFGTSGETLLTAVENGGIYRSDDGGITWSPLAFDFSGCEISGIAGDGTYIYVSTYDRGILRSDDFFETWEEVNNGLADTDVSGIYADGDRLYASVMANGIYTSADHGDSWSSLNKNQYYMYIWDLVTADTLIFTTIRTDERHGIFRTSVNGTGWVHIFDAEQYSHINKLAILDSVLYATSDNRVYESKDLGDTWSELSSKGLGDNYITSLAASANALFVGTAWNGVLRFYPETEEWKAVNAGLVNQYVRTLMVHNEVLYAGTLNGIFRSVNSGGRWYKSNTGLSGSIITSLAFAGTYTFAGSKYGGVFRSADETDSWLSASSGLGSLLINGLVASGDYLLSSTGYGYGVYRSSDNGVLWRSANSGITNRYVYTMTKVGKYIFVGSSGCVYRTSNDGAQWQAFKGGLPDDYITKMAASGAFVYAATWNGQLYQSSNLGQKWTVMPDAPFVQALVANDDYLFAGTDAGLFRYDNTYSEWAYIGHELDERIVTGLFIRGNSIFAGTNSGIFQSEDQGDSWFDINEGLPRVNILAFSLSDEYMYIGTEGRGVWRKPLSEIITAVDHELKELPDKFFLDQNYPNPFNSGTVIRFHLPDTGPVLLTVYDILGNLAATLVDEQLGPGSHKVRWDAGNVASGLYICRMEAGGKTFSVKMVLIK